MNYLWAGMMLLGIVYGGLRGEMATVTEAVLSSAKEAVSLCITLMGVMCFWMGMMHKKVVCCRLSHGGWIRFLIFCFHP